MNWLKGARKLCGRPCMTPLMSELINIVPSAATLPALFTPDAPAAKRTVEFFPATIRNP